MNPDFSPELAQDLADLDLTQPLHGHTISVLAKPSWRKVELSKLTSYFPGSFDPDACDLVCTDPTVEGYAPTVVVTTTRMKTSEVEKWTQESTSNILNLIPGYYLVDVSTLTPRDRENSFLIGTYILDDVPLTSAHFFFADPIPGDEEHVQATTMTCQCHNRHVSEYLDLFTLMSLSASPFTREEGEQL